VLVGLIGAAGCTSSGLLSGGPDPTPVAAGRPASLHEGWAVIAEMTQGGFGFDAHYKNLVAYLRTRDFAALCRSAGIAPDGTIFSTTRHRENTERGT